MGTENTHYLVERTDTAGVAEADRTAFWADHVRRNHGSLRSGVADPGGFRGRTVVQRSADRQLVDFWSGGVDYVRTALDVRRDGDETLRLLVPVAGSFLARQGDRAVTLGPGTAGVVSKASPFRLLHRDAARALILTVPAEPSRGPRVPRVIDVRGGVGAVIATMLSSVAVHRDAVDGGQFRLVADTVAELLRGAGRDVGAPPDDALAAVDAAVREHVRAHAHDPALSPARIARDLGWSVRQVQLALARTGTTPSALLRDARLGRARDLLERSPALTVADVAYASGFRSLSVFGARFRERFGSTPAAYRREHRP